VREVGGADQLLHFGSKTSKEIRFHISFGEEVNQYNIQLRPSQDDSLFVSQETVSYWKKEQYGSPLERQLRPQQNGLEAGISDPNVQKIASWVRHRLSLWRVFHVHDTSVTSPMRKTAKLNDNAFLRPDGSNLPAFLYRLQAKFPSSYSVIRATIQRVAPFFDDFLLRPDPLNEEAIRLEWKHKNSDQ
jgi:predicted ATPase